ncbi:hypothetical protein K8R61_02815 [bacterium]|nr:hypothetical protein [bacterium]
MKCHYNPDRSKDRVVILFSYADREIMVSTIISIIEWISQRDPTNKDIEALARSADRQYNNPEGSRLYFSAERERFGLDVIRSLAQSLKREDPDVMFELDGFVDSVEAKMKKPVLTTKPFAPFEPRVVAQRLN